MTSINEVCLAGHIGRVDVRAVGDTTLHNVNLATQRNRKDSAGQWQSETDWHRVTVWSVHEKVAPLLAVGAKILVKGRLQTRSWDDQHGQKRYATEVVVNNAGLMILAPPKASGAPASAQSQPPAQPPQQPQQPQQPPPAQPPPAAAPTAPAAPAPSGDAYDDEIPF